MSEPREKRARRSSLGRLIGRLNPGSRKNREMDPRKSSGDRLKLESLEKRQLLAGDMPGVSTDPIDPIDVRAEVGFFLGSSAQSSLTTESAAEGEPAPDLVQFAKDLEAAGVIFYGAHWCPACTEQKQLFQDGGDDLPFVEVTNPDRSIGQIGIDNNITAYPTWTFADQTRETGVLTLQQLSDRSGVAIPQSEDPTFDEVGDQTALIGSPIHLPIDAYDPDGGPLTVTVSVSDSNLLEASVITGNRSIRVDMAGYGEMVFELFEQRAPTASGRVIELAEAGFYDDIIFHRVIDDFVIQGGDPTGTGTSGSALGNFDDDFHPDLQHNRSGILSFAKSSDDTNNSQFFVTEVPTRFLDFNHSVFGQLIEGEDVRDAISEHAVNGADRPTTDISINTIDVFTDTENSLVMLKPTGAGVGSTNVTVTVTDQDGNSHSETFQVDVNNDTQNSQPFLNATTIPDRFAPGTPATLQLSATDVEGDAVSYSVSVASGSTGTGATASVDQSGLLTVTPADGFTGTVDVTVTVRPGPGVTGNSGSDSDNQRLTFNFENDQTLAAPSSIDLAAGSDTGSSDSDNITNAGSLEFIVDGVTSGANVQLINLQTGAVLGEAVATGTSVTVTTNNIATLGDGVYNVVARQISSTEISELSSAVGITYDTTEAASVIGSANTRANVDRLYQTDLINSEEGSIVYALTEFPNGATINSGSGLIQWTPGTGDVGDNAFTVTTTDLAGNTRTESFTVNVSVAPKAEIKLSVKDSNGNEISNLNVGDEFVLELIGVDARGSFDRDGVYAIYADILFDSAIVQPKGGTTIEYVGDFALAPKGSFSSGLIDELGAASTRTIASNESESVIVRVQMEAVGTGSVNIRSEEADESSSEVLLFGDDNQISADSVFFGNVNLTVGLDFTLNDDAATVAEDSGATVIDVLGNDTSTGSLSVVSVTQPTSGGTVTVDSGVISFTPDANFNGTSEFTYRAGDGSGAQDIATVTMTVTSVNDPPTGVADTFDVIEGSGANELDVLANDLIDPDTGETLTVTNVESSTANATVEVTSDGSAVNYTPPAGFTGTDTFIYTVSDGEDSETVTVTVTVTSSDAPPTAEDDSFTINEDTAEASYDILTNDVQDVDGQTFVLDSVGTPDNGGSVRISSDGSTFFYTPAADFFGTESVTYTIRDSGGGLSTGNVTFTVDAINDAPPALDTTVPVNRGSDETVVLDLTDLPNNVDGPSETLTLTLTGAQRTTAEGGKVAIDANGNLTYQPPGDSFTGTDTVTYSVSDGSGTDSTGTLTIQVQDLSARSITVNLSGNQGRRIAGLVRLTGTDTLGNDVSLTSQINAENNLYFADLLPGDYVVEIPAVPFFIGSDEAQQFTVNSELDDGDTVIEASMGRLKAKYISIQDWLGSTPAQSVLVVVEPGAAALITEPSAAVSQSIIDPTLEFNAAGTELTITGSDDEDPPVDVTASVLISDGDIVKARGQIGNLRLFRVNVANDVLNYVPVTDSTAGAGEGESTGSDNELSDTSLAAAGGGEAESAVEVGNQVATSEIVESEAAAGGLSAAGTGEAESVAAATSVAQVTAPQLSGDVIAAVKAQSSQTEDEDHGDLPAVLPTTTFSRRGLLSSASQTVTPADVATDAANGDEEAEPRSEDGVSSSLSASRVDRFFRLGR